MAKFLLSKSISKFSFSASFLLKIINSEYFIEMPLSAIMIEWHLRKIFSFDFTLEQKNDIDYIITIPNGIENMKIDFSINNK